jgi:hypothetical protein
MIVRIRLIPSSYRSEHQNVFRINDPILHGKAIILYGVFTPFQLMGGSLS